MTSFFFNVTATTEIYTLSLHDALPIWARRRRGAIVRRVLGERLGDRRARGHSRQDLRPVLHDEGQRRRNRAWSRGLLRDRKSTRLNSSHGYISYAVFCLKKKKKKKEEQ